MKYLCIPEYALRSVSIAMGCIGEVVDVSVECINVGIRAMDIIEGEVVTDEEYRSQRALPEVSIRAINSGS